MKYLNKSFSVLMGSKEYRDGYDKIVWDKDKKDDDKDNKPNERT